MSDRLRAQYPEQMTIILQHQFWDLTVNEHGFEVGLSFGGIPEKLSIPFEAINGFFDPSVQFGLQFEEVAEGEDRQSPANAQDKPARRSATSAAAAARRRRRTAGGARRPASGARRRTSRSPTSPAAAAKWSASTASARRNKRYAPSFRRRGGGLTLRHGQKARQTPPKDPPKNAH